MQCKPIDRNMGTIILKSGHEGNPMGCRLCSILALITLTAHCGLPRVFAEHDVADAPDLIIYHAKIVTVDDRFRLAEAIAIKADRIVAVGDNTSTLKLQGAKTRVLDVHGRTVLPGLYDSHVHPLSAATSELTEPLPNLKSLDDVFSYIRKKAKETPEGEWIVMRFAFPTRLQEARFPTLAELDEAAPRHPVLYNAGPASMVNTMALKVSGITKNTPNPPNGVVVRDPATGEATGLIRNADSLLKKIPPSSKASQAGRREAVKKLFALYNAQGITSIGDRNASREALDLYYSLHKNKELTVRINVARSFNPYGTREQVARRFDDLPGKDHLGGPTGTGGIWIRIGPIKFFLDGGMLNGTAYMRRPWPKGETYQIVEDDYRGLLFVPPEQVKIVVEEASKRKWQVTAHTAGEGAMDVLLDAYEFVNRYTPIKDMRHCITHANFPSKRNLERCKQLGVCADVQPAWLYKDGATLARVLGKERIRWFQPFATWLEYTTIGGGSDHMIKLDDLESVNPWNPWLGMAITLTRKTEAGRVLTPDEGLTRSQALRLYTINNAYLHNEEKDKGTLEPGKLADLIVIDRDYLTCPLEAIAHTRVLTTIVGGQVVYEARK
jgi:predicted amidohydrolase YtcJ